MPHSFQKKIIRDFDRAAKNYDSYAALQRQISERLFTILNPAEIPNGPILDIGCGTGYFHELLRKNKIYLPLVQCDISPQMCAIANSYASSGEYGQTHTCAADMHNLPFAEKIFTTAFSSMSLQWSENLSQAFSEIGKTLKHNATYAFSIVAAGSLHELIDAFKLAGYIPPINQFASKQDIDTALSAATYKNYHLTTETITTHHPNLHTLLKSIKNIGASFKAPSNSGLRGKNYFQKLEKTYLEKHATAKGLPLSWEIIYVRGSY